MTTRTIRTIRSLAAAGVAAVSLGACSPQTYIETVFGPAASQAVRVAQCESGLNPNAVSPGGGNHGLFQINNVHASAFESYTGQPWSMRYDPLLNSAYAKHLWDQSGWRPWTCQP